MLKKKAENIKKVQLGDKLDLEDFVAIVRYNAKVDFSVEYKKRVRKSRELVEKWINEEKVMYGVNTGFGALHDKVISKEETKKLQENIILSHSTSVGEAMSEEEVRATMLMVLQNAGQGYSGIRLEILELYRKFLNNNLIPFAPREGSIGYLSPEAHIAMVVLGKGKAYYNGELLKGKKALEKIDLKPYTLSSKEGLVLISGTTSVTGLGAMALYDIIKGVESSEIIGAMNLEISKGTLKAYDERLMEVRPHPEQKGTAKKVREILSDSEICQEYLDYRVQDALSLRCIPQLHGASKKTLKDAIKTVETEINSCTDNPIIWSDGDEELAISGCNPDSSYVGLELDSAAIAATMVAKMSERRNNRLIDGNLSEYPWFLIKNPGLNSGLMIPQYTQAGLLNDMRTLSQPAVIDNIPTCGNQEDYVAMGYNSVKKAFDLTDKLEYILAIELLSIYQAHQFLKEDLKPASVSQRILDKLGETIPVMKEDMYLYPHIEKIKKLIHNGVILNLSKK